MALRVMSWLSAPRLLKTVVSQARLAVRLFREPHVPVTDQGRATGRRSLRDLAA